MRSSANKRASIFPFLGRARVAPAYPRVGIAASFLQSGSVGLAEASTQPGLDLWQASSRNLLASRSCRIHALADSVEFLFQMLSAIAFDFATQARLDSLSF